MSESAEKEALKESSEGNAPEEPDFGIPAAEPIAAAAHGAPAAQVSDAPDTEVSSEKRKIFTKETLKELFFGFRSRDAATRKMTIFFYLSLFVFIGLMGSFGKNWYRRFSTKKKIEAAMLIEAAKKAPHGLKAKEKELIKLQLNLGEFMLELRPRHEDEEGKKAYSKDRMNIATIEIIAECDSVDTCHFIEEHIIQVRDQMILILTGLEREVPMSREGKQKVKRALIDKLNHWLGEHGVSDKASSKSPIENLYFNRLVLT